MESAHLLLLGPLEASSFGGGLSKRVRTLRAAGAVHKEGGAMMVESPKREGSSERVCPLPCKDGETETQGR